jgi:hypothetical protein
MSVITIFGNSRKMVETGAPPSLPDTIILYFV